MSILSILLRDQIITSEGGASVLSSTLQSSPECGIRRVLDSSQARRAPAQLFFSFFLQPGTLFHLQSQFVIAGIYVYLTFG